MTANRFSFCKNNFKKALFLISTCFFVLILSSQKAHSQGGYMSLCSGGLTLEEQGNLDGAIEKYSTAITLKPDLWNAYSYRGKVYYRKGKHDLAISDLTKAIELSKNKLFLYHVRGNSYLANKNYEKAIADYNIVLTKPNLKDPQLYQIYLYRAEAYYFNKQYEPAIIDFKESIKIAAKTNITPTNSHFYLANSYFELKKYTEAIQEYDLVISANAYNTTAIFYQGLCYYKIDEIEKAKTIALKLIEMSPSKEIYFSGSNLLDLYNMEMRRKVVNQALITANAELKEYYTSTSKTIQTVKLASAFAQLDKAWLYSSGIEKSDRDINDTILNKICKVYSLMKESPDLPELARKYLVQANASMENKKYTDALGSYNKAISIAPYYPLAYYNRSLVNELLSYYSAAITDMKKYIELSPNATNLRSAQDKIYEWEGNIKSTVDKFTFSSADGNNKAVSNSEKEMNNMAINIENVIENKIEKVTDNKARQGFFMGYGLSTPRKNFGLAPTTSLSSFSPADSVKWKYEIFDEGRIGAKSGWYAEIGVGVDMEQSAKVQFHYNPFVFSYSRNKLDWYSRSGSSLFNETNLNVDSTKALQSFEMAQRYGISFAPIPKLVGAFYYRIGVSFPFTSIALQYDTPMESFKLTGTNNSIMPFNHTLGFSISYAFITLSYEWYSTKLKYQFKAYHRTIDPFNPSLFTEEEIEFNGKLPIKTNRIGISIHF